MKGKAFLDVIGTYVRIWLGDDHLLYQLSTSFTEDYKRFYYRDIQAITIRKTKRFMIWNIILAALCLASGLLAVSLGHTFSADPFLYMVALVSFVFLLLNLSMGPTCICQLYTFVSAEELYSLKRLRTARKALKIIVPLIEEKQRDMRVTGISPSAAGYAPQDRP